MVENITQERLMHLLHYDPTTGRFTWMQPLSKKTRRGDPAGFQTGDGYWAVRIDGHTYRAHRLAVLYMTGQLPPNDVDHRNRSRQANEWENLRKATRQENTSNRSVYKWSKTGVAGVTWDKAREKWSARIKAGGKGHTLGRFDNFDDAVKARREAEIRFFGEFAP